MLASASFFANPLVIDGHTSDVIDELADPSALENVERQVLVLKNTLDWMATAVK